MESHNLEDTGQRKCNQTQFAPTIAHLDDVSVRKGQPGDEIHLAELVKKQGWDFGVFEIRVYMKVDPDFLLVAVDNTDTPLGFIGLSRNTHDLYYVSNFIVREDVRRKGVGRKLWTAVLDRASNINMCVDSGSAMIQWFMKNGFKHKTFLTNYYRITVTEEMQKIGRDTLNIKPLSEELWPSLMKFDHLVYPNYDRETILRAWFKDVDVEVLVAMKDDVVCGYGCIIHRPIDNAYSLRNVFADDEDVLEEMLGNMFEKIPTGSTVCFNMLQNGKLLPRCLKSCGKSYGCSQRLYTETVIESRIDKIWFGASLYV